MPNDAGGALSLAIILTAAGATVAAGFVTGITELFKNILNGISPLPVAFILSAILVVAAYVSAIQTQALTVSLESLFAAVLAWYGIARLAKAHYDDVTARPGSLRSPPDTWSSVDDDPRTPPDIDRPRTDDDPRIK